MAHSERSYRKRSESTYLRRNGEEPAAVIRYGGKVGHVLDDRDAVPEQPAVGRTVAVENVVDVHGVDADERRLAVDQRRDQVRGEKRRTDAISVRAPMAIPAGVKQHRVAGDRAGRK